ncbi:MAG: hypothetical protein ACI8TX_000671 [Hyphomicrobiaceae bacterium]|jgi:hypothetical protein
MTYSSASDPQNQTNPLGQVLADLESRTDHCSGCVDGTTGCDVCDIPNEAGTGADFWNTIANGGYG